MHVAGSVGGAGRAAGRRATGKVIKLIIKVYLAGTETWMGQSGTCNSGHISVVTPKAR